MILLLGLFQIGVGTSFLTKTEKIHTVLKKSGPCLCKKSKLFGPVIDERQFDLKDVMVVDHHVTSRTKVQNNGRPTYRTTSEVSLILKGGSALVIGNKTVSPPAVYAGVGKHIKATISIKAPLEAQANKVATFIGVKVKQNEVSSDDPRNVIDSLLGKEKES